MQRSIVIVGAGPAGMAAAIEAVAGNCRVTLLDEAARPGGQIYRQAHEKLGDGEFAEAGEKERKKRLLGRFKATLPRIDYRADTTAYAAFGNGEIHIASQGRTERLKPDAVILATGVRELAIPFPGWTIPGVMFAGGAQAILKSQRILPGQVAVVAGAGPLPMVVAAQLLRAGGKVAALAGLHSALGALTQPAALWKGRTMLREGLGYGWTVLRAGVPMLTGYVPVRATGTDRLKSVVLARTDRDGSIVLGTEREIACDLLAVNYGFVANSELAAMAGAAMRRDPAIGGWIPVADAHGRTSLPWLYVAGDGAGLRGALVAESEGAIVGAAAAGGAAAQVPAAAVARRAQYLAFQQIVRRWLRLPPALWRATTDDTIVCRCENIHLSELRDAIGKGHESLNAIKRNSRAGMGWCGGRMCLHSIAALAEQHAGVVPGAMMTPRPMARPVAFAALAQQEKVAP